MQSKYLEQFKRLRETANDSFVLNGDRMIVEVLEKEELKTAGGLHIASSLKDHKSSTEENRSVMAVVLLVGEGHVDEDGNDVPVKYQPGELIMLPDASMRKYTQFSGLVAYAKNEIALTRESEVHISWPSFEAYEAYKAALNGQ